MKVIILLFFINLISGCATNTIKVVDEKGKAVEGAVVLSQTFPYMIFSWKLGIYITDKDGEAKVVSDSGFIFKPGYFPVIEASELKDGDYWRAQTLFSSKTQIYPIIDDKKTLVTTSIYLTKKPFAENKYSIPIQVCMGSRVTYNFVNSYLKVKSDQVNLLPSDRFHFVGPSQMKKVSEVGNLYSLAFYCFEKDNLYKVGVVLSKSAWDQEGPDHRFTIYTSRLSSVNDYIQPEIKCATKENIRIFTLPKSGSPDLYISNNIEKNIADYKLSIPCENEYTDKLFKYVESYL